MSYKKQRYESEKQSAAAMQRSAAKFKRREWFWRIFWAIIAAVAIYFGIKHQVYRPVLDFISSINKETELNR